MLPMLTKIRQLIRSSGSENIMAAGCGRLRGQRCQERLMGLQERKVCAC